MKNLIIPTLFLITACGLFQPKPPTPRPPKPPTTTPAPTTPTAPYTGEFIGVTIDAQDYKVADNLAAHKKKLWARIVFDEFEPAKEYLDFVSYVEKNNPVMGELLDSFYVPKYSVAAYKARAEEYLDVLGHKLKIIEVMNEINGEWVGKTADVVEKLKVSYDVAKSRNKQTAITLYYNEGCYEKESNEMFTWAQRNIPDYIKEGVNYVLVSYYQEDCENQVVNWSEVFAKLKPMFPNSYIGVGESGLGEDFMKKSGTTDLINKSIDRCYDLRIDDEKWKLGCFYWFYNKHMKTKGTHWNHLNSKL